MRWVFSAAVFASIYGSTIAVEVVSDDTLLDLESAFTNHLTNFGLTYSSVEEFEMRKNLFAATDKFIREHNSQGHNFTVGHNQFSDRTP